MTPFGGDCSCPDLKLRNGASLTQDPRNEWSWQATPAEIGRGLWSVGLLVNSRAYGTFCGRQMQLISLTCSIPEDIPNPQGDSTYYMQDDMLQNFPGNSQSNIMNKPGRLWVFDWGTPFTLSGIFIP